MMRSLFCQMCGERFDTDDLARRFCGLTCAGTFSGLRPRTVPRPGSRAHQILTRLRAQRGAWISTGDLTRLVYGQDDEMNRRALTLTLVRIRHLYADVGLCVERRRFGQIGPYHWCLTSDINLGRLEVAG